MAELEPVWIFITGIRTGIDMPEWTGSVRLPINHHDIYWSEMRIGCLMIQVLSLDGDIGHSQVVIKCNCISCIKY